MSEAKTPKAAMGELLALTPVERAAYEPANGVEEVAKTYLEKAISDADGGMLKYIIDLIEKSSEKPNSGGSSIASKFEAFASRADEGIDE